MSHLDSAQAEVELRRDLSKRAILDVAKLEDLAIGGGERLQRSSDPRCFLIADGKFTWTCLVANQLIDDWQRWHFARRGIKGPFARDRALRRFEMEPTPPDYALQRELSQPYPIWHRTVAKILRQPASGIGQRLLNDIGRVNPSGDPPIKPSGYHVPEAAAMTVEEQREHRPFGNSRTLEQVIGAETVSRNGYASLVQDYIVTESCSGRLQRLNDLQTIDRTAHQLALLGRQAKALFGVAARQRSQH